jgi:hypothetical protein
MTKELTPLEALERLKNTPTYDNSLVKDFHPSCCEIIETTLKNYEELTSKPVILCRRTHESSQALIDTICKNYKEVKVTNLEDEKKLKALEIVKEKKVDVQMLIDRKNLNEYNWCVHEQSRALTQEEYDLLKEVLL